jgi:hypothetical protein
VLISYPIYRLEHRLVHELSSSDVAVSHRVIDGVESGGSHNAARWHLGAYPPRRAPRSDAFNCATLEAAVALNHHALAGIITLMSIIGAGIRVGRGRVM